MTAILHHHGVPAELAGHVDYQVEPVEVLRRPEDQAVREQPPQDLSGVLVVVTELGVPVMVDFSQVIQHVRYGGPGVVLVLLVRSAHGCRPSFSLWVWVHLASLLSNRLTLYRFLLLLYHRLRPEGWGIRMNRVSGRASSVLSKNSVPLSPSLLQASRPRTTTVRPVNSS